MIAGFSLDPWGGLPVFLEVFAKSGVALGAALGASALLRKKSADLRRLTLSSMVAVLFVGAALMPALPRWTVAAPVWLQPAARAAATPINRTAFVMPPSVPVGTTTSRAARIERSGATPYRVPMIPLIWLAGTAVLLVRFGVGLLKLRRLRISSSALYDEELDRMGHRPQVSLLRSESIDAPVTWGILRPVILVPARFEQLPAECRGQALCHELAHIQSHDFLVRALAEMARALLWFQPLMWIVRRQLREEQELACDDRVLAAGGKSSAYAKLLLDWDSGLLQRDSLIAVGMAQRSCLKRRLYALLDLDARRDKASRAVTVATWLVGLAAALPLAAFHVAQAPVAAPRAATVQTAAEIAIAEAPPAPPPPASAQETADEIVGPPALDEAPQDADSHAVFEVAAVKHGAPGDYSAAVRGGPGTSDPTTYTVENYPLSSLLGIAYGIRRYELSGPKWLEDERFTVNAKLAEKTTKEQLKPMMQNLLIERFKLAAHFETRELSGYQLVVGKGGAKLTQSAGDPSKDDDPSKPEPEFKWKTDKDGFPELPPGRKYSMAMGYGRARWRFADIDMGGFASMLGDQINQPIVNATGLKGNYDFTVAWATEGEPSIFTAVQEQLGLKLEAKKVTAQVLVIDHIERNPSEN